MNNTVSAEPGTVKVVRLPEPERGEGHPVMDGTVPALDGPVVVELHGHRHRYVVRAARTDDDGPVITDLRVLSDDGAPVDHGVLRAVNLRRLAYTALQWLTSAGGQFAQPGDTAESFAKPERAAKIRAARRKDSANLADVAVHVLDALDESAPVLEFVAERMTISTATAGRLIRRAKVEGFLPDKQLPRRKPSR